MRNFSLIQNEIFEPSQLSALAVLLYCILIRHCGKNDSCYPGQELLGKELRVSPRYVREITDELIKAGLVYKYRRGYNRPNTYKVSKHLEIYKNCGSYQIRSIVPLHNGPSVPTNNKDIKVKDKKRQSTNCYRVGEVMSMKK